MWWKKHKHSAIIAVNILISVGLFAGFLLNFTNPTSARTPEVLSNNTIGSSPTGAYQNTDLEATVDLVNQTRSANGASGLIRSPELDAIAEARALDMKSRVYYAHKSPDGRYFNNLMDEKNLPYTFACENLNINESTDPDYFVKSWLNSPAHKDCMLKNSHVKAGYAVVDVPIKTNTSDHYSVIVAIYSD